MTWLEQFRPARVQGITWVLTVLVPFGVGAGLDSSGVLHVRLHGFWPLAGLAVLGLVSLAMPGAVAVRNDNLAWARIPVCGTCGRKMVPVEVRVSWWSRLRYYRCDCTRTGQEDT